MKHLEITPGPWIVGPHPGNGAGTAWRQVLSAEGPFGRGYVGRAYVCEALEPDARLIAAAPDMLAVLRALIHADDINQGNGDYCTGHGDLGLLRRAANQAREIIRVIEGEE